MFHTMATIKCRRSRGYKPETKQVVTTATGQVDIRVYGLFVFYIFFMDEDEERFVLNINWHKFVVATSYATELYGETWNMPLA